MPFTNFEDVTLSSSSLMLLFRELTYDHGKGCKLQVPFSERGCRGGASLWDNKYRKVDTVTQEGLVNPAEPLAKPNPFS